MNKSLQLISTIAADNTLTLSLTETEVPTPGPKEVLVRMEAAPLNPTDMATLLGPADLTTARASGTPEAPVISADIPPALMGQFSTRIGTPITPGTEGAGVVIAAGDSPEAQALLGKTVGVATGNTYGQHCCAHYSQCVAMPAGVTPAQAASSFVNPMTALGLVETMRLEGHKALVNTAAASKLGQMLNRLCLADGIELVNIVRNPEQEAILRDLGAKYVVNSASDNFLEQLTDALADTGATIAFDAIGGGEMAHNILSCMERVAARGMSFYNHYGSRVPKRVYIYGFLDRSPLNLRFNYGFAWDVGGWLLTNFMAKAGQDTVARMRSRVAAEITTTFATEYTDELSLREALVLDTLKDYSRLATGRKYLIRPQQ